MTLSLDGAQESMSPHGHSVVECIGAAWAYRYDNGYTVTLRGPLTAHVVVAPPAPGSTPSANDPALLKFEKLQFDANSHDKYVAVESILGSRRTRWEDDGPRLLIERGSLPGELVNPFGIPQASMRCLEVIFF